jgi:hypothetical protein
LGVDELGGEGEALFEASAGEPFALAGEEDGMFGDGEALGSFVEIELGLLGFEVESEMEFTFEFEGGVEMGAGFGDLGASAMTVPEVPLGFEADGVAIAGAVEFPAVIVVIAAESADLREPAAASLAELCFGGAGLASSREEFETLRGKVSGGWFESRGGLRELD